MIALEAYDKGLLGTALRYPYEVRKAEDYEIDHSLRRGKRWFALLHRAGLFGLQVREQRLLVGQETRARLRYPFQ